MIDFPDLKKKYDNDGYVVISELNFENETIFKSIEKYFEDQFLKFKSKSKFKDLNLDPNNEEFIKKKVSYRGWSKKQILFRNQDKNLSDENSLEGKRGVLNVLNIENSVVRIIENEKILNLAKNFLNEKDLVFLNGSFAVSYPGNLGEGKRFHSDITAFNNNKKIDEIILANKHVCNIMIFVSDIKNENAPMRVLPKSHIRYQDINKKIAESMNIPFEKSYVPQAHVVFDEVLDNPKFQYLTGKKGTIVAMNSFSMHAATENLTKDETRNVIILNYGPKNFGLFKRGMNKIKDKPFYNYIKNKKLFEYNTLDYKLIKTNLRNFFNISKSLIVGLLKIKFIRKIIGKTKLKLIKLINQKREKNKLNIGAGIDWYHPEYKILDAVANTNNPDAIQQDLVKNPVLPFFKNSLQAIYSSHCLEHLKHKDLIIILHECHRVLKIGGALRITLPNIRLFFESYKKKDMNFITWMKDSEYYKYDSWLRIISRMIYEPVVNNLSDDELYNAYNNSKNYEDFCNFLIKKSDELNLSEVNKDNFFPDNHKNYFNEEIITNYLKNIGFNNITISEPGKSKFKFFQNTKMFKTCFDVTRPHMSLYVECTK